MIGTSAINRHTLLHNIIVAKINFFLTKKQKDLTMLDFFRIVRNVFLKYNTI